MGYKKGKRKQRREASQSLKMALAQTGLSLEDFFAAAVVFSNAPRINVREVVEEFKKVNRGEVVNTSHRLSNPIISFADWVRTKEDGEVQRWMKKHSSQIQQLVP